MEKVKASPSTLVRKYRRGNMMIMAGLVAGVGSIYFYTMWSVAKDSFSREELSQKTKT